MTQESSLNDKERMESDALELASFLYDIYQKKKLEEKGNVSSDI